MDMHGIFRLGHGVTRKAGKIFIGIAVMMFLYGFGPGGRSGYDNPCEPDESNCAKISTLDFIPLDNTYAISKPSGKLDYKEVEHFNVKIVLDRDAPQAFSRKFNVMDSGRGDKLGELTASFAAGSRTPSISYKRKWHDSQ